MKKAHTFLAALCLLLSICGCSISREAVNAFKSKERFIPLSADSRIYLEPGAEDFALNIQALLPAAISRVEAAHYREFKSPVKVYLCATTESFVYFNGQNVRGKVAHNGLFLSPRLMEAPDQMLAVLSHELSHLHLMQQGGVIKLASLPFWFSEGLATFVSEGGGAESVSVLEASSAILEGRSFIPHEDGGILFRKTPSHWELEPHMFYRQSMMFVSYLYYLDHDKFRTLILAIEDGEKFRGLMKTVYGKDLPALWEDFKVSLTERY